MAYSSEDATKRANHNFTFHAVKDGQAERYEFIRNRCRMLAHNLIEQCPESRERSVALTKLEEVCFWANAAIARHE